MAHLDHYPIPPAVTVRKEFPPDEIADWLMTRPGEQWSHHYHHGGALWHRSLRMEAFATILDTHNDRCECETTFAHPSIFWGSAYSPVGLASLETGQYGIYEPSPYLDSLSSPA